MKKVCLIGNNAFGKPVFDGQRIKVRTYKNVLEKEGFEVNLVDLDKPIKRILKIFKQIKTGIKKCDVILLITSDNGEKILVPYINRVNKKYQKRFVFSQIGTSFLFDYIKNLTEDEKRKFFHKHNFLGLKPRKKIVKNLKKIDIILTETDLINSAFSDFFDLDNCRCVTNFRDVLQSEEKKDNETQKLIYLSRVTERKGIFDLLEVVNDLKKEFPKLSLDIYGTKYMDSNQNIVFESLLGENFKYCGELSQNDVISTLTKYDLLCFPTKCEGEGTPGCIIESLIAGTPVLSSSFTQSDELLTNNYDSLIYTFNDNFDLRKRLLQFLTNTNLGLSLSKGALESGKKYTYLYNREKFLKYITGENNEK